jgi:hypothetical protein
MAVAIPLTEVHVAMPVAAVVADINNFIHKI